LVATVLLHSLYTVGYAYLYRYISKYRGAGRAKEIKNLDSRECRVRYWARVS